MRINGIGVAPLGIRRINQTNTAYATQWFTFIFLPLIPFSRIKIELLGQERYRILQRMALKRSEVLRTYLVGLIGVPVIMIGPIFLITPGVSGAIGLSESFIFPYFMVWLIWFIGLLLAGIFGYEKQLRKL